MTSRIREEYKENTTISDSKKLNRPYMIWKIEGNDIYAFPITTRLDKYRHIISKENYPTRQADRCLKDTLVHLHEHDITTVIDKITTDDYEKSINSMYSSICHCQKGHWSINAEYFMNSILQSREVNVGTIIMYHNPNQNIPHYYYIFAIDYYQQTYTAFEVDGHFLPIDKKNNTISIDMNQQILAIIYPETYIKETNQQYKGQNNHTKILTKPEN